MSELAQTLPLGLIQTTVDCHTAWSNHGKLQRAMTPYAEQMVMDEIRKAFKQFADSQNAPRIILIPEYSLPCGGVKLVREYAKAISAVVIGGMDLTVQKDDQAYNKGTIFIPNEWPKTKQAYRCNDVLFGKYYFSDMELRWFKACGVRGIPENTNYIIDAGIYGNIGVAICADFYDLERFVIYKGKIHHLFIIAYNQDYKSFEFLAEAISRLLMCNVVICNTGHYGDSLAYSPYAKEHLRTIYKSAGQNIFSAQTFNLPVAELDREQTRAHEHFNVTVNTSDKRTFKWAPGYKKHGNDR